MDKITKDAAEAFMNFKPFSREKTAVVIKGNHCFLLENGVPLGVYNNLLKVVYIGTAKPLTRAESNRLNGLPYTRIEYSKKGCTLNGRPWDFTGMCRDLDSRLYYPTVSTDFVRMKWKVFQAEFKAPADEYFCGKETDWTDIEDDPADFEGVEISGESEY